MNDIENYKTRSTNSTAIATAFGLTAALAFPGTWPASETPVYTVNHSGSSYSAIEKSLVFGPPHQETEFARHISDFYASLSAGQEPLGAEFETVWNANVAKLYES